MGIKCNSTEGNCESDEACYSGPVGYLVFGPVATLQHSQLNFPTGPT